MHKRKGHRGKLLLPLAHILLELLGTQSVDLALVLGMHRIESRLELCRHLLALLAEKLLAQSRELLEVPKSAGRITEALVDIGNAGLKLHQLPLPAQLPPQAERFVEIPERLLQLAGRTIQLSTPDVDLDDTGAVVIRIGKCE